METKKAYIVEDYEDMRILLKRVIRKNVPSFSVIGESETAEHALQEIPNLKPDLVLVDISLPGMDGIELIRNLRPRFNSAWILVVTGHNVDLYKTDALEAGANDIVSKSDSRKLIEAIERLSFS